MRYKETSTITISEDNVDSPKKIRFQDIDSGSYDDTVLTKALVDSVQSYAVGTTVINLGSLTAIKYIYVKPTGSNLNLIIDGSLTPVTVLADKPTRMWVNATSLSIVNGGSTAVDATVVVAGT